MENTQLYRIKISGTVPDRWLDRLGGMRVTTKTASEVVLEGALADQSALIGVLNTLYQLHLPLLEVTSHYESPNDLESVKLCNISGHGKA